MLSYLHTPSVFTCDVRRLADNDNTVHTRIAATGTLRFLTTYGKEDLSPLILDASAQCLPQR
jgi:hypothetical protein